MNKLDANNGGLANLKKIEHLRRRIDKLDSRLITLLRQRFQIVEQIGALKKEIGLPIFQKSRWTQLIQDRVKLTNQPTNQPTGKKSAEKKPTENKKMRPLFIRDLFTLIHSESLDLQKKLRKPKMRQDTLKEHA